MAKNPAKTKAPVTIQDFREISQRTRELARQRIQVGNVIARLQESVIGEREMSASAVKAATVLLQVAGMITNKVETETTVKHEHSITAETINLLRATNQKIIEHYDNTQSDRLPTNTAKLCDSDTDTIAEAIIIERE